MLLKALLSETTRRRPEPESGAALGLLQVVALFVSLTVDIGWKRVGKHFLEGGWEHVILIVNPPCLFLPECILWPSNGRPHSQPPSVNNVPNNYVTVFGLQCEKVGPPS